ncbi:hypothetical protein DMENIID0001_000910 [Sergentomyia squamirostris]
MSGLPGVPTGERVKNPMCPCYDFSERDKIIKDLLNRSENVIQRVTTCLREGQSVSHVVDNPSPGATLTGTVHLHGSVVSKGNKHLPKSGVYPKYTMSMKKDLEGIAPSAGKFTRKVKNPPMRKLLMGERRGNWFFMPSRALFPRRQSQEVNDKKTRIVTGKITLTESWRDILSGKQQKNTMKLVACDQESTVTVDDETSSENALGVEITDRETPSEYTEPEEYSETLTEQLDSTVEDESIHQPEDNVDVEISSTSNKNSNRPTDVSSSSTHSDNLFPDKFITPSLEKINPVCPGDGGNSIRLVEDVEDAAELHISDIRPEFEINERSSSSSLQVIQHSKESPDEDFPPDDTNLNEIFKEMLRTVNSKLIPRVEFESQPAFEELNPSDYPGDQGELKLQRHFPHQPMENPTAVLPTRPHEIHRFSSSREINSVKWVENNHLSPEQDKQREDGEATAATKEIEGDGGKKWFKVEGVKSSSCYGCNHQIEINYSCCSWARHRLSQAGRKGHRKRPARAEKSPPKETKDVDVVRVVAPSAPQVVARRRFVTGVSERKIEADVENFLQAVRESIVSSSERDSLTEESLSSTISSDNGEDPSIGEVLSEGEIPSYSCMRLPGRQWEESS